MRIVKVILGIVMILAGALLVLAQIIQIPTLFQVDGPDSTFRAGYLAGKMLGMLLFGVASFFLIRFGIRFTRQMA